MKYIFQEAENLHLPEQEQEEFSYRDHENADEYLYDAVRKAGDRSSTSPELTGMIRDWPSRAHLSPLRGNLLRPFREQLQGKVLEIGAGCGAISRVLGEFGAQVTALEPVYSRARICAERTRDLQNVRTICDSLARFQSEEKFDAVVVIGVLEYATAYGEFSSFEGFLKRCRSFLKEDGRLFLAIENQLGVKYLTGTPEDHLGISFIGVNDAYPAPGVKTFSKQELLRLLTRSGFVKAEVYAPFPDYKFPVAVLSKRAEALEALGLDVGTLVHGLLSKDPQLNPQSQAFSLEQAFKLFARNGNSVDVANSLLLVASPSQTVKLDNEKLCAFYGAELHPMFQKETVLLEENGKIVVRRARFQAASDGQQKFVTQVLENSYFVPGRLWSERLLELVNGPNWSVESLLPWCSTWLDLLTRTFAVSGREIKGTTFLAPEALDASPFNLIEKGNGEFEFFDLEWRWHAPVELGWVFLRGLFHALVRVSAVEKPQPGTPLLVFSLVEQIAERLNLGISSSDLQRFFDLEHQFLETVLGCEVVHPLTKREIIALRIRGIQHRSPEELLLPLTELIDRRFQVPGSTALEKLDVLGERLNSLELDYQRTQEELERVRLKEQQAQAARESALEEVRQLQAALARKEQPTETPAGIFAKLKNKFVEVDQQFGLRESTKQFFRTKKLIEESELFDEEFYLRRYPDAAWSGLSPVEHYLKIGAAEGRQPNLFFDPEFYLDRYPDVAAVKMNPFLHFLEYGAKEGRSPSILFDSAYYLRMNPDLAVSGINPLRHFLEYGWREGRNPHPDFDVKFYISRYRDVRETGKNPLEHFLEFGGAEGRRPNPEFDSGYYLRRYPDVRDSGMNPLAHYLSIGRAEGRKTRAPAEELRIAAEAKLRSQLQNGRTPVPRGEFNPDKLSFAKSLQVSGPLGISVVMPTFNRVELLRETLEACRAVEGDLPIEYIVVDDGSSDGTAAFLESRSKEWSKFTYRVLKNGGPGRARNVGAALATKEIVLFLGDDIQPLTEGFFRTHYQLHEKCRLKNFGVLGKAIWPWLPSERFTFVMGHIQGHGGEQFGYADLIPYTFLDWSFFYTCNVSVKRSIVENWESEGFSPEFPFAAFEDAEFAYRMTKRREGFHLYYDPSSVGQHRHEYDVDGFIQRQQKAGMMASVLLRLHPELAEELYLQRIVEALNSPTTAVAECNGIDYRTFIEGAKSLTRIVGRTSLLGTQSWHDALISATFGAAFLQGLLMNWNNPAANFAAGYQEIFKIYLERVRGELHVAFGELANHAIEDLLQKAEPPIFWM
jgi:GT2 family glycosyltransferase/2-polyprenyl-3-methyl-5-hydroxy-6-metoxy-1,4-benzoquinol methylase